MRSGKRARTVLESPICSVQNVQERKCRRYVRRNVAHTRREIMGRFCAEVYTYLPAGT